MFVIDQKERFNLILFMPLWVFVGILLASKGIHGNLFTTFNFIKIIGISLTVFIGFFSIIINRLYLIFIPLIISLGFGSWKIAERNFAKNPILNGYYDDIWVEGRVVKIIPKSNKTQVLLGDIKTDNPEISAQKILFVGRVNLVEMLQKNDLIGFKGDIFKMPALVYPSAYPYNKKLLFEGIEGMGKIGSDIEILQQGETEFIENIRNAIRQRFFNSMKKNNADVGLALFLGDRVRIDPEIEKAIRFSGLSHILAISGFHLVIIIGFIVFVLRLVLSRISYICLRFSIQKISYISALILGFLYLWLANFPLPAIRSYLMLFVILSAAIINRIPTPARAISFGAIFILLTSPTESFFASFQLSFAAILSLVLAYQLIKYIFTFLPSNKTLIYFISLIITSIFAGFLTTPFVLHHFGNFSTISLLANLICIPLTSFFVMPLGFLAILLTPFATLSGFLLKILEIGIICFVEVAVFLSKYFPALPLPNLPSEILFLFAISLMFTAFFEARILRILGFLGLLLSIIFYIFTKTPVLVASHKFVVFKKNNSYHEIVPIKDEFVRDIWLAELGQGAFLPYECQDKCEILNRKVLITRAKEPPNPELCNQYKLIIDLRNTKAPECSNYYSIYSLYNEGTKIWVDF